MVNMHDPKDVDPDTNQQTPEKRTSEVLSPPSQLIIRRRSDVNLRSRSLSPVSFFI